MTTDSQNRWLSLCYAVTIFVSAFLLFQVQPLISKYILPWFGGTPAVWTTCMLFFQTALFAGYAYAHIIVGRLSRQTQAIVQIVLIAAALLLLPITPDASWKPTGDEQPTLRIILLLAASVGLPFFMLSSTGPLLQGWFSRTHPNSSPYRLYALSNLGSLLALVSYPFLVEPNLSAQLQAVIWSWGFLLYTGGCTLCALGMRALAVAVEPASTEEPEVRRALTSDDLFDDPPTWGIRSLWFGLAMAASVMLLATTNQVCMDVASVPFLWILPLTLYLLSFILCFDSERWYSRWAFTAAMVGSIGAACRMLHIGASADISTQLIVYFSLLFFCAMFCHGELVALKPHPRFLTMFYLYISAGGAAGGLFVGLIAPYAFPEFIELPIGMIGCAVLMMVVLLRDPQVRSYIFGKYAYQKYCVWTLFATSLIALIGFLGWELLEESEDIVSVSRNFYGVLRVKEKGGEYEEYDDHRYTLTHGRILHGVQFTSEEKRRVPTTYYAKESGVGLILTARNLGQPKRVGIVGLGTGTIAAYAKPDDVYRFYDINPEVIRLAEEHFTYLNDCEGEVELVLGDARLSMESEEPQHFDVIVLDAFSSDAIPMHLLTVEAFEIYRAHLVEDGVLAIHISNRHFELRPVVEGLADHFEMGYLDIEYAEPDDDEYETSDSEWMLVSDSISALDMEMLIHAASLPQERRILWTDDRSNLFEVLK